MDHRGAEFASIVKESLEGMRKIAQTRGPVVMYPASGSGAWEAAIVNTLSPGDRVLMFETGHFSRLWRQVAERFGIRVDYLPGTWRTGAVIADIEAKLSDDKDHQYKAVMVVHNETSTGTTSKIFEIRQMMNRVGHPALLMVDAVSSLGSIEDARTLATNLGIRFELLRITDVVEGYKKTLAEVFAGRTEDVAEENIH